MKILHIGKFDAAAAAWHQRCALIAAGQEVRTAFRERTHVADKVDVLLMDETTFESDAAQAELRWADLVIVHVGSGNQFECVDTHEEPGFAAHRSKMMLIANGSAAIRDRPVEYRARYDGFRGLATNHDVATMLGFKWLPACIDAAADAGERMWKLDECEPCTLAHPWTDEALKGCAEARQAAGNAGWKYREITGLPLGRSLRARGGYAAVFDHFKGYFGLTTMEASAMGQPCAVGYSEAAYSHLMEFCGAPPPWRRTPDHEALANQMRNWAGDPHATALEGRRAREWHAAHFTNAIKAKRFMEWVG